MAQLQPPPPNRQPVIDSHGLINPRWLDYFITFQSGSAPANGPFIITTANTNLPGAEDLGLLTTGYAFLTVAAATAAFSTLTRIPGTDVSHSVVSKTFADTGYVALNDQTVLVDATGGATTIKLPATLVSGSFVIVKKTDASANAVTVSGNGALLDGAATQALPAQWNAFTMQASSTAWFITGNQL